MALLEKTKWGGRLPLLLLMAVLILNVICWGSKKEGFHVDEMFSYGQVCSPKYLRPMFAPGYLYNWHDSSFFGDFLTIGPEEAFDLAGTWNTAKQNDAHPPLFFVVFELVTSLFFLNHFTKWSGLATNLVFFALNLAVFYLLCKRLLKSRPLAMAAMAIYGIGVGAVGTAIYLRMYMMLTFFSTLLLYAHSLYCEKVMVRRESPRQCVPVCFVIAFTLLGGALTMYYFLFFAFFVCLFYGMALLWSRHWKHAGAYTLFTIGSMALYAIVCPSLFRDLLDSHRGKEALSIAADQGHLGEWLRGYACILDNELFGSCGGWLLLLLVLLAIAWLFWRRLRRPANHVEKGCRGAISPEILQLLLIFLACACTFCTVARIAPYRVDRYIMNLFPGLVLSALALLLGLAELFGASSQLRAAAACVLLGLALLGYARTGVNYLYPGQNDCLRRLEQYRGSKAVYLSENVWDVSNVTPYLVGASSVFVAPVAGLSSLSSAFATGLPDGFLLYVGSVDEYPQEELDSVLGKVAKTLPGTSLEELFRTVGSNPAGVYHVHAATNGTSRTPEREL